MGFPMLELPYLVKMEGYLFPNRAGGNRAVKQWIYYFPA